MTVKDLLNHLNKLPDESLDMNARVVTNCGKHDIWHIDLGGYIYCIEDDIQENPAELRKKLRKARKKAKRWKRKYLELRYDLDKAKTDNS